MSRIDSGHHLWRQSGFTFHPHETRYFHREPGKENEEDGGAWRLRRGSWWSVERNNSESLSLVVFLLIWVHFIDPWPEFLVNGLAPYFL